jgi:hypothetical protein
LIDLLREMENEEKEPSPLGFHWLRKELGIDEFED